MSVTQNRNLGRSRAIRAKTLAMDVLLEATSQVMRQIDFERERKAAIIKNARHDLLCSEHRIETLIKHLEELRSLAGHLDQPKAAA